MDDDSIVDAGGNPLGGPGAGNGDFTGQTFNVVTTLPWSTSSTRLAATEGQAVGGVLATFTDSRGLYSAGDYSAQISWGDGGQTTGTVTYDSSTGQFDVSGSYTYGSAGDYDIQVSISDPTGLMAVTDAPAAIADAPLTATGETGLTAVEGTAFSGTVATFVDPVPQGVSNYTATIAWGDGQTSTGTVTFNSTTQQFRVAGGHVYADYGSYSIDVTISEPGGALADATSPIAVADAPLLASGQYVLYTPGVAFSGTVATFTHIGGSDDPSQYTATITWATSQGQSITAGTVSYNAATQQFAVGGSFTFPDSSGDTISVTISDSEGTTRTATSTPTTLAMSLVQVTPTAGTPFSATVATFTDTDPATVDNYWATITWGDGSTSTVTSTASAAGQIVADPNGGFDVVASHTYQQYAASDTLSVLIDGTGRNGMELGSNITVADAPLIGGA